MGEGLYTTDAQGRVTFMNPAAEKLFGWTLDQLRGKKMHDVTHYKHRDGTPFPCEECPGLRVLREGNILTNHQDVFIRRDGTFFDVIHSASPIREGGKLTGLVVVLNDVSEHNRAIEEVRQAKEEAERASRRKDEFLAALSHELRTPLTPVLMTAAALREEKGLPSDVRQQLAMIERNVELEARLIDDLLDLARVSHGKLLLRMQPCDAHGLVALALDMVGNEAASKRHTIEVDLTARRSLVTGDPARLQQVFWNLIRNAVKFTPESGHVIVRSHDRADHFVLEISDSGVGISPGTIERIFLPFEQGRVSANQRSAGLGLGLSIAKAILDLHGGTIRAESGGAGKGATFCVELPATEAPLGASPGSVLQPRGPRVSKPLRLLVVEDHQPTLDVIERLLRRTGHSVKTATSVAGALQLAGSEHFDVVISDLGLPDGTGFELMTELRTAHGLRGIALSGYGMDEDLRRSHEAGFSAHLTKPIDFAHLERALEELMADTAPPHR
jgi:PAS domain S-box-containing protein